MVAAAAWMLFQASRHEPSFYRQALRVQPTQAAEDGANFEHEVLELRNESLETGNWEAAFTAEQLNGWMAVDLPEKFPAMLPRGVEEPRVAIEDGLVRVAARYRDRTINSIVSFALELQLADEPNTIAVCIRDVRAGALPIPIATWLEKVQKALGDSELAVRWSQSSDDPVALVQIPISSDGSPQRHWTLESLAIEDGEVRVSGSTALAATVPSGTTFTVPAVVQRPSETDSESNETTHR
jgi:hypothetical protein